LRELEEDYEKLKDDKELIGDFEGFSKHFSIKNARLVIVQGNMLLKRTLRGCFDYNIYVNISLKTARSRAKEKLSNETQSKEEYFEKMREYDEVYLLAHHQFLVIDEPEKAADYNIIYDDRLRKGEIEIINDSFNSEILHPQLKWFCEPKEWSIGDGVLCIKPDPISDYWQRTYYGFSNDNAHFLYIETSKDFQMITSFEFEPIHQFDQAGLCVRIDEDNWIKLSSEYLVQGESPRLGTVVTNLGYSDWSMMSYPDSKSMTFRLTRIGQDYIVEYLNGIGVWSQMRLTHLHNRTKVVKAGLYCCSPIEKGVSIKFKALKITELIR